MRRRAARTVFILVLLAGCASAPPPRDLPPPVLDPLREIPAPHEEGGGAATLRARGEDVADFALQLRGAPYRFGGATPAGFDCSGLVFFTHRQLGLPVPRTSRDQAAAAREVKQRRLRRGDLVFFRIGSRVVNHVGIYVGDGQFVHAPGAGKAVTTNSLDDEYYAKRFTAAGRYWDEGGADE